MASRLKNPVAAGLMDKKEELITCWRLLYDTDQAIRKLRTDPTFKRIATEGNKLDIDRALLASSSINKELDGELDIIKNRLREEQSSCDHEWEYDGHDSHKEYEKCTKCGAERSV